MRAFKRVASVLGTWQTVCLLVGILLLVAAPRLEATREFGSATGFASLAGLLLLMTVFVTLGLRFLKVLRQRLFHKVRNRIIATYFLTGVLPLLLMLVLFVSIAQVFMTQLSGNLFKQAVDREFAGLEAAAAGYSCAMQHETPDFADSAGPASQAFPRNRYPGSRLLRVSDDPESSSGSSVFFAPESGMSHRTFLLLEDTVFMAVAVPQRSLMLAVPIRNGLLERIGGELGGACMFSYGFDAQDEPEERRAGSVTIQFGSAHGDQRSGFSFSQSSELQIGLDQWLSEQPTGLEYLTAYLLEKGYIAGEDGTLRESMIVGVLRTRHSFIAGRILQGALPPDVPVHRVFMLGVIVITALFVLIELVALTISLLLSRSITETIAQLHKKADYVARGDFSYRIDSKRTDQLGILAASFDGMSDSLETLMAQMREKERLEHELAIAREVQRMFFPGEFPRIGGVDLFGRCLPARMVSGDYYDCIPQRDGVIDFFVGDISGKGISAALLMAGSQTFLRSLAERSPLSSVPDILQSYNDFLVRQTSDEVFSTLFYGRYDPVRRTLAFSNAGHPPPFLFRCGESARLTTGGLVSGIIPGTHYEQETIELQPGDLVVVFTDGFTEVFDEADQEFGEERLSRVVTESGNVSLETLCDRVVTEVLEWSGVTVQSDDMTMFLIRVE
ncbi:MAG: PP2C family protein-serine/threonine phosphatase [Candidatus Fermentibacteraceae bacterium]